MAGVDFQGLPDVRDSLLDIIELFAADTPMINVAQVVLDLRSPLYT